MTASIEQQELKDRLSLIETMIAEGRRTTESWGWTFVLWGVAYYAAILWATLGRAAYAWPVTMMGAVALTMAIILGRRKQSRPPNTSIGRAITSIWIAMGISMMVLFSAMGSSHRMDQHIFVAVVSAMLGMANAASALTLKWKMQFACAVVWWAAAAVACFAAGNWVTIAFLAAIFFCQIVFGAYGMIREAAGRRQGAANA